MHGEGSIPVLAAERARALLTQSPIQVLEFRGALFQLGPVPKEIPDGYCVSFSLRTENRMF